MIALASELVTIGLVAGLMGLDRRGAFQMMVSQPIVAIPLLGLLIGDPVSGLMLGALVQLLWMSSSLFGATVPPNETAAGLAIGGMVFLFDAQHAANAPAVWALAVLLGAPVSLLGRWLEQYNDRANLRLARRADAGARMGRPAVIDLVPWRGLLRTFVLNAALVCGASALGWAALSGLEPVLKAPATAIALGATALYVLPAIGLGVALANVRRRRGVLLAAIVFVVVSASMGSPP